MKKPIIIIGITIFLLAGSIGLWSYVSNSTEDNTNKIEVPSTQATSTTDNKYYDIQLVSGERYVSIIYRHSDGKIQMWSPFIATPEKIQLYCDYKNDALRTNSNGNIRQSDNSCNSIFLEPSNIKSMTQLDDNSQVVKNINDSYKKASESNPNPLNESQPSEAQTDYLQ